MVTPYKMETNESLTFKLEMGDFCMNCVNSLQKIVHVVNNLYANHILLIYEHNSMIYKVNSRVQNKTK